MRGIFFAAAAALALAVLAAFVIAAALSAMRDGEESMAGRDLEWRGRRRTWFGAPWTATEYAFDAERLFVSSGLLSRREDEMRLYRVLDLSLSRSPIQRLFGLGTLKVASSDRTLGDFDMVNIRSPREVKERLSTLVEAERDRKRVVGREFIAPME